ncbi:MAG: transcriptional regulator, CopG family protein [halophilic archaeon J07HB67]|nr:MAG: transcriptional regulator, CopG family protein [halophilic archaeon J07HB67]
MRTSLRVPDDLLAEFDAVWEREGIDSRSRAVREAMAEYVERHSRLADADGEVTAVFAFDYEHHAVIESLHATQHDYQDVITATSHAHQGEWCLETVFCRGSATRVRELLYRLRDFDGVRRVEVLSLVATGGVSRGVAPINRDCTPLRRELTVLLVPRTSARLSQTDHRGDVLSRRSTRLASRRARPRRVALTGVRPQPE